MLYLKFNQDQTPDNGKLKVIQHADELSDQLSFVRSVRSLSSFQKSFSEEMVRKSIMGAALAALLIPLYLFIWFVGCSLR